MIEKNANLLLDPKIKRIVEYTEDNQQVNVLDQRFYRRNGDYYPSVTSILNYFPKNKFFHDWLKDVGHNSEIIAQKAAYEGTLVHTAAEKYVKGEEIVWVEKDGTVNYPLEVWKMILKFADFWTKHSPRLITTEYHLFSDKYRFAGTADLVCELKGKIWLLDIKTSNSIHTTYELQLSAYAQAWNETHDTAIEHTGILWLKAATRGEDKKGEKIQGAGWQLKSFDRSIEESFEIFNKIYDIYKLENPDAKPSIETLPLSIKM
jgi:hypothetical protein